MQDRWSKIMDSQTSRPFVADVRVTVLAALFLAGCSKETEIRRYTVPRTASTVSSAPQSAEPTGVPSRTLAAIVPHKDQAWFFKITGPDAAVATQAEPFDTFLKTVTFGEGEKGEPKWSIPADWKEKPGNQFRFATIEIPAAEKPLELTVIPLPMNEGLTDDYILSNVNRWRDQLQLAAIPPDQLSQETKRLELAGGVSAVTVNFAGTSKGGGMGGMGQPPFAGGGKVSPPIAPPQNPTPNPTPPSASPQFKHDVPEGWAKGKGSSLSVLAYEVRDGNSVAEITVTPLSIAGGDWKTNVNRWRGQVKLEPAADDALAAQTKPITVGKIDAQFVELVGPESASPRETILGVAANEGDTTWFIKLKAPAALAEREKANFEKFVRSLELN